MTATATEAKERTIYTVKGTSAGAKIELTKHATAALAKASEIATALQLAPGLDGEASDAALAIERLLAKVK